MNAIGWVSGIALAMASYAGTLQAQERFYISASAGDITGGIPFSGKTNGANASFGAGIIVKF